MKTIHIHGHAKNINLLEELSNNNEFPESFCYGEVTTNIIPGMFFRLYNCGMRTSLKDAMTKNYKSFFGEAITEGEEVGYSEYTIEGFNVHSLILGGHNLQDIITSYGDSYLHILIDFVEVK